jgi:hypothetical protein
MEKDGKNIMLPIQLKMCTICVMQFTIKLINHASKKPLSPFANTTKHSISISVPFFLENKFKQKICGTQIKGGNKIIMTMQLK